MLQEYGYWYKVSYFHPPKEEWVTWDELIMLNGLLDPFKCKITAYINGKTQEEIDLELSKYKV